MIYDHIVKHNGKYYAAGENVPENVTPSLAENTENFWDSDSALETEVPSVTMGARRGRPKKNS